MLQEIAYGVEPADAPPIPPPEGPLTEIVTRTIVRRAADHRDRSLLERATAIIDAGIRDPLADLDLQLALDLCYELHYQSFRGVDPAWEWDPTLLEIRFRMESVLCDALAGESEGQPGIGSDRISDRLLAMEVPEPVLRLARYVELECSLPELRELVIHRSAVRLKRPDAFVWALPRLRGRAREALVEIAEAERLRRHVLSRNMRLLDLDERAGAYRDLLPASTLASVNLFSLFGLRRHGRGAMAGHLAMQQLLDVGEDRACAGAVSRLCSGEEAGEADPAPRTDQPPAIARVAVRELAGRLASDEPGLTDSILFGAHALLATQARSAAWILASWGDRASSLLEESHGFGSG